MKQRLFILALAIDHLLLVIFTLGNCKPGEYISSAVYELHRDGRFFGFLRPVIDWAFSWWQSDHCYKSWSSQQYLYKAPT